MAEPAGGYTPNRKRETAGSAIVQIIVVGALVAGSVAFYAKRQAQDKDILERAVRAKEATEGDDAAALLKAKKIFDDLGEEAIDKNDAILSAVAELDAQLYQAYGIADAKPRAIKHVEALKARESRSAERYAAEAYLLLGDGKAAEAEQVITALTDKGIRHAKLLHALSVAKLAQGKAKEAVVAAQEGQKLNTQLARLPIAEGDALLALGNIPSAANAYLKARKINPDHLRARTALTLTAAIARQGKPELLEGEMDRLLQEATAASNGNPPPRVKSFIEYAKGEIYLVDNDATNALKQAEASLQTDPGQPAALALRGRALAKLGKADAARSAFDEALKSAPASLPIAQAANDVLARSGKAKDGIGYLERVVTANPDNGMAYVGLSLAQSAAGQGKDALANANKAIERLGNAHDLAIFAQARAFQADNQLDKARETYGEALANHINQQWPELFFAMGQLRVVEKNYEDAVSLFDQSITFWDKQGASFDLVADAYEQKGKALEMLGKKRAGEARAALDKAASLRKGSKA